MKLLNTQAHPLYTHICVCIHAFIFFCICACICRDVRQFEVRNMTYPVLPDWKQKLKQTWYLGFLFFHWALWTMFCILLADNYNVKLWFCSFSTYCLQGEITCQIHKTCSSMHITQNSATLQKVQDQSILSLNKTRKCFTENWKDHAARLPQNLLIIKIMVLNFPTFLSKTDSTTGKHLSDAKLFFLLFKFCKV